MTSSSAVKLIAVDGSEHSINAIDWFFENIYRKGDEVAIVHIHVLPDLPGFGFTAHPNYGKIFDTNYFEGDTPIHGDFNIRIQASIDEAKKIVDKYKEMLVAKGVTNPHLFVETMHDSIGHTICQVAHKHNASLIVIGQRGLGVIRRTLFGSVSNYVLHHAHIPVLVVPPKVH